MTMLMRRYCLAALAAIAAITFVTPALAETINMKAQLKPSNEVPPNNSKASGDVSVVYDTVSKKLSWKGSYSGLTGPALAAHFHAGEPGKNGGVVVPIFMGEKNAKNPFEGSQVLTDAQAAEVLGGHWYINVHTPMNQGGEIRGQVTK